MRNIILLLSIVFAFFSCSSSDDPADPKDNTHINNYSSEIIGTWWYYEEVFNEGDATDFRSHNYVTEFKSNGEYSDYRDGKYHEGGYYKVSKDSLYLYDEDDKIIENYSWEITRLKNDTLEIKEVHNPTTNPDIFYKHYKRK